VTPAAFAPGVLIAFGLMLAANGALAHGPDAHPDVKIEQGDFTPPEPGTYELPPISRVPEFRLLAPGGERSALPGLGAGQVAIVCTQASGCPLALSTRRRLDRQLARSAELAPRVRLVTVSFDPARDTPDRMGELARALEPEGDWRFLTAADAAELGPVLERYGQDVVRLAPPGEADDAVLRHVLKVFLVDARGDVRNIYSTGFLDTRLILADVRTVLGER
jgi:cytochrome oxidase Cu insertion factor (SCO1/SenC/PrrC family)